MNKNHNETQKFDRQLRTEVKVKSPSDSHNGKNSSEASTGELLQKLRTQQIELDIKNEELRCAYAALEVSRNRYTQLFEQAPVGYLTLTEDGQIVDVNFTFAKIMGVDREKLIKRRFADYVKSNDADFWHRHCLLAMQHSGKQNCELTLRRDDSTTFQARLDCLYMEAEDATPLMHITLIDISERQMAEEALEESELRQAQALACADLGSWHWDIQAGRFDFSNRWAEIRGYLLEEIVPDIKLWKNGIHPGDLPVMRAKLAEHLAGRTPFFQAEYRVPTKSGSWAWVLDRGTVNNRDVEGNPLGMAGVEMDITDRKQTEQSLRIAAAAFEAQEGIIVTDTHKVILRANHAFSGITGYSPAELIGGNPSFLSSGLHGEAFYQAMWSTVNRDGYWHGEIWDKRKNGEEFPLWLTLTAVTGADERITHYVGTFTDITVQKQAEKVLLDTRAHLENQVVSTKEEFEKLKQETAEVNSALKVLLKYREKDKTDAQNEISSEVTGTILPFLKKLKGESSGRRQSSRLISIIESNLEQLVQSYGRATTLPAAFQQLTRVEMQVASMVRQGLSTKVIAKTLNISPGTVSIHRKHIRKKLGLNEKADNLHSFLLSLTE
jgi:PAS domain S-box-containing protein